MVAGQTIGLMPGGPVAKAAVKFADRVRARLDRGEFSRNVSVLLVSTVIGQAAGILLSPVLTRMFGPEEFGLLSVYSAVLGAFGSAACLRYEIAIPLARSDEEGANAIGAAALALLVCTTAVSLACVFLPSSAFFDLTPDFVSSLRSLLPIGFFAVGLFTLLLFTAAWRQDFDGLARARVGQGIGGPTSQIGFGLLGLGSTGLALGFVVGQAIGTAMLFKRLIVDRWSVARQATPAGIRRVLWANRAYPLITAWATVLDALGNGALLYLLLRSYYPGFVAGYIFLAERVVARPLVMMSNSMVMVFIGEVGSHKFTDPARLRSRFRQITSRQFGAGLIWVLAIDLVSTVAFPSLFGQEWEAAIPFVLAISVAHLAQNVIQSVSNTLQALDRQVYAASWQIGRVAAICVAFVVCHRLDVSALTAVEVYSAIQAAACLVMYCMIRSSIDRLTITGAAPA